MVQKHDTILILIMTDLALLYLLEEQLLSLVLASSVLEGWQLDQLTVARNVEPG